jgi:tetratricopeptide (TPR) repeat protein
LDEYIKSFKNHELENNEVGVAEACNGIGSAYYAINEKAIQYLKISLSKCEKLNAYNLKQKVLDGLGRAYTNLELYDEALLHLENCIQIIE